MPNVRKLYSACIEHLLSIESLTHNSDNLLGFGGSGTGAIQLIWCPVVYKEVIQTKIWFQFDRSQIDL